ncbi:putative ATP-dependent RNA helicase DDX28, partial [Nibea albiflora]
MHSVKVGCLAASRALSSCKTLRPDFVNVSACCGVRGSAGQTRFCQTAATPGESTVIRIPRYMQQRVDKVKETRGRFKIGTIKAGRLLIQSKNPDLNQSVGYIHGKFEQPSLCSKGWKHRKSFGDYFTINNIKAVAPFVSENQEAVEEKSSFSNLRICKELVEALDKMNITHPTTVQLQTIPKVMKGQNILCAAETGSGKTLSYLLPVVHRLQAHKESETYDDGAHKIRTVVLVPSRELAEQVAAVSRTLCAPFGLLTKTVGGGRGVGHIKMLFKRNQPDILVATPGALVKALRRRYLDLS